MVEDFPLASVRERFPALGEKTICLDNPAGTQLPSSVIDAMQRCAREAYANLHGYFSTSKRSTEVVERAHEDAALLLGAKSGGEVALGSSMTELTYHMSRSLGRMFSPGDEILITTMDHEGNVSPWLQAAEDFGLVVRWLPFDMDSWRVEEDALRLVLSDRTKLLALNYASNLTGSLNDVTALARIARDAGALVYVDGVQYAPHRMVDVSTLGCDFFVCSAYKFFGPHMGVLWGREELLDRIPAYRLRCGPKGAAEKFERGTPQMELHAGLSASVSYLQWLGGELGANAEGRAALEKAFAGIRSHEESLVLRLLEGLEEIPGIKIYGLSTTDGIERRVPTVSFTHDKHPANKLASELAHHNVHAWSGHNYAYSMVEQLELESDGVLRLGAVHYNSMDEVESTLKILREICAH